MHPWGFVASVFVCCSANVMILEMQIRMDPGSSNLITFCQFLFVAAVGFVTVANFGRRKRFIPLQHYAVLTAMYFIQSLCNNRALSYNISMPMHMIVKSGSLVASMVLGAIFLTKSLFMFFRYPFFKWLSIMLVTTGIAICTLASADSSKKVGDNTRSANTSEHVEAMDNQTISAADRADFVSMCTGLSLVGFSVFVAAGMGIYQEYLFGRFGRHAQEGIFYSHALPLPGFILISDSVIRHFHTYNRSDFPYFEMLGMEIPVPLLWLLMAGNVVTYLLCSSSVFSLITVCSSLTVTLVLTLRKFMSIFISIYLFNNAFTFLHWIGTAFVMLGTFLYVDFNALRSQAKVKTS